MRYWTYEDDQLSGPFSPDELRERPRFGPETLVIAEERLDPAGGRWRRAADVPPLALVLSQRERAAFVGSLRPPEPAVRDLSVLGNILEQVDRIEGVLVGMRDELDKYRDEADKLWRDNKERESRADRLDETNERLARRLEALEALSEQVSALRSELVEAQTSREALEGKLASALARLESASMALDAARSAQAAMAAEIQELRSQGIELRADLDRTRDEALRAKNEAAEALRQAQSKSAASVEELAEREESRWLAGGMRFSPGRLAVMAGTGLALGAIALALAVRMELRPPASRPAPAPEKAPAPALPKAEPAPPAAPEPRPAPKAEPKPAPGPAAKPAPRLEPKAEAAPRRAALPKAAPPAAADPDAELRSLAKAMGLGDADPMSEADRAEAGRFTRAFVALQSAPGLCPRGADELVAGVGGPARTPQETLDCWAWRRVGEAADLVAKARRKSRDEALAELQADMATWGGFDKVFPLEAKAARAHDRAYTVVLSRTDRLAERLKERYGVVAPGGESSLSYEADMAARSLRPLDAASWRVIHAGDASKALPGMVPPAYKR